MTGARYELRVAAWLSERAKWAFPGMRVAPVRTQTSICAELDDETGLHELLERCSGMGLRLISVRRLQVIPPQYEEDVHEEDVHEPHRVAGIARAAADRTDGQVWDSDSSPSGGAADPGQEQPSAVGDE